MNSLRNKRSDRILVRDRTHGNITYFIVILRENAQILIITIVLYVPLLDTDLI